MDIDTNKTSGEEEYHPADYDASVFDVTPTASSVSSGGTSNQSSSNKAVEFLEHLKRKNIIIAVIVLIGIFCVYKIVDVLFTPGIPRHKVTEHAQIAKPIPSPEIPPVTNSVRSNQNQISATSVVNRLDSLEQRVSSEQADLTRLTGQINDLQASLSNVDLKLSTLTGSLQIVADEVAKQHANSMARQVAKRKIIAAAPRAIYYVKAMVPGRAWLATQDGGTITVSLGNNLPGYGTVEAIEPNQGTLTTSSGAIIGYSSDDS